MFQGHPGVTTGAMTPPTIDSPPCSSGGEGSSLSGGGIIYYALREDQDINEKKVFFRALPESLKPPNPNLGNFVFFFGHQNSRFEKKICKNVGRGGRYINNLKNS